MGITLFRASAENCTRHQQGDVDGASRQPVERAEPLGRARRGPRREQREPQHVAARQRELRDLLIPHGRRYRRRSRLDNRRTADDVDVLLQGADGKPQENLYAMGPVARGRLWEVTAVPEIRQQAAALSRRITLPEVGHEMAYTI